jgi:uncharacterized protein
LINKTTTIVITAICFILGAVVAINRFTLLNAITHKLPSSIAGNSTTKDHYDHRITVKGKLVHVEIADTNEKMEKGLSGRNALPADSGMLFTYTSPYMVTFWMPDMRFPLDMVFIRDSVIADIIPDVPIPPLGASLDSLPRYSPPMAVTAVLELPSGWCKANQVVIGDEVKPIQS